ncbi:MAG: nucleotidyltransferase domain-containing protein [Erysipelotrichaceae bacterium]|jgi:predicted nucleotidyltransferase|nr:nucleotidyltransferase domain-containing protein [Erysipelotrichaceae bacterium]
MEISYKNSKVFYRFVEFCARLSRYDLSHEDYKMIALDKKEANTIHEKKVKRIADAMNYLIASISQIVDQEILLTFYYLLTKKRMNTLICDRILEFFYEINEEFPYEVSAAMILFINSQRLRNKLEYSILFSSFILIKHKRYPIIISEGRKKQFLKALKAKDLKQLVNILIDAGYGAIGLESGPHQEIESRSVEEIISILEDDFEEIRKRYRVKHLFLYGSIVKNTTHHQSDLDFLVIQDGKLSHYEQHQHSAALKEFLETKLLAKCDVLDFSCSLKHAEIKEMNNKIKIF